MMRRFFHLPTAVAIRLAAGALLAVTAGRAAAQASAPAAGGVRTMVELGEERREIILVGRRGKDLVYRPPTAPAGVTAEFKRSDITAGLFLVGYDEFAVYKLVRQRQFVTAAQTILRAIGPTLPYLDIPENNTIDPAMDAGRMLFRGARIFASRDTPADRANANKLYASAFTVLKACGAASWHPFSESCTARAALCLVELGKLDEAGKLLDDMRAPNPGDAAYGIYWLTRARLQDARGDSRGALDAAIQSVLYENKDIDTFPDALMLCAQCYEDILEVYRTRDIYYAVARLFPGTEWADTARERLKNIRKQGLTRQPEQADAAHVFFGVYEDMNALVDELLTNRVNQADEPAEEEEAPKAPDSAAAAATGGEPQP